MARRQCSLLLSRIATGLEQQFRTFKTAPKKIDVTLAKDVEGLGEAGTIVKVSAGYARNFLVPRQLAVQVPRVTSLPRRQRLQAQAQAAASAELQTREQTRQVLEEQAVPEEPEIEVVMRKLTTPLLFKRKAEGQALVVPIGREDIVETVSRQLRIDLAPELLDIGEEQLKETGEFYVPLKVVGPDGARARLEVKIMST